MGSMRFSVITTVYVWNEYRKQGLKRAAKSVSNQTFKDFEYIIVDDGSPEKIDWPKANIIHKQHEERVQGFNTGLKHAKGEILCFLDSDDEYEPNFLERVDHYFKKWPKYKMFNFGVKYVHNDGGERVVGTFKPKKRKVGHQIFAGGTIVNGSFVFHRDIYDKIGAFPPAVIKDIDCSEINYSKGPRDLFSWTPFDFSAMAQMEFPEIRQFYMVDHVNEPNKIIKELGNPWGQDYYLFYKYTRKYHSKPVDEQLLIVHPKGGVE